MEKLNYTNAKAQLSQVMDSALSGHPIEITRKGRASVVVISKSSYEKYKKEEFENKCQNRKLF
ncbi:type II toxin-antitoxin system Phd/YefM family antitoxin [Acinetobacter sp. ABJ_C1_1]|uniref:type II toxin-antitoxin system Phd/YefM family antitoxin n=1 Tax=Acinetobacter sp. ABJ_C1_1 TaxID=3378321 RepID=UPI00264CDE5A|nr:type II toxin-antitoxin system Phd/YefM family antitoxin [Acinetobacter baumannii]